MKNVDQLTYNENRIFQSLNKPLPNGKFFFLGPDLKLALMVK